MSTTRTPVLPMVLSVIEVCAVERLSPAFVRVELTGPGLADLGVDGPFLDQRIKLVLPGPGRRPPAPGLLLANGPAEWYPTWLALPDDERGAMRTYTVRALHGTGAQTRLVVDVVVHESPHEATQPAIGPGCRWALEAEVGDEVLLLGPRRGHAFGGIEFQPGQAGRLLLVGDETAAPAIASILETLPLDAAGTAYVEVPSSTDILDVRTPAGVRLVWLPRNGAPHGARTLGSVSALFGLSAPVLGAPGQVDPNLWETPRFSSSGDPVEEAEDVPALYAWVAGEAAMVTRLRRLLVREAGLSRSQVAFMGYWREGVAMRA